jgi:uncharacterized protein (DUF1778 family)
MQTAKAQESSEKPVADDRITARIPHAKRIIIERAAAVYGATLNQFIVQTALDRAGQILEREETLRLSERDSRTFLAALDSPPEPSQKLIEALKAHSQLVKC